MKQLQVGLLLVILMGFAVPAQAQLLFSRKPRPNATQRVPELILTIKTDKDESKRQHAAEELREYDATTYTEIVPVLADVLRNDKKVSVRSEALSSLAKIRPVQPLAVQAIEKAGSADESWRIRWQAKSALTRLQIAGIMPKKSESSTAMKKTEEPPLTVEVVPPTNPLTPVPPQPSLMQKNPMLLGPAVPRPLPQSVNSSVSTPLPSKTTAPIPVKNTPAVEQGPSLFP